MQDSLYLQKHMKAVTLRNNDPVTLRSGRLDVPIWALSHFGKDVKLSSAWSQGGELYRSGDIAKLDGIQHYSTDGSNRALLLFYSDGVDKDSGYPDGPLVDVPFNFIEAPPLPLDLVRKIPGRAGEIAFMWANGVDVRSRVSRSSFYRYRAMLLEYSVDILKPFIYRAPKPAC